MKEKYAYIEYDNFGNIIYEDYTQLEEYIQKEFVPEFVNNKEGELYCFFKDILKLNLSNAELIYFIDYLKNSNINIRHAVKYTNKDLKTIEELPNIDFIPSPYYFKGVNISFKEQGELLAEYAKTKDSKIRDKLILSYLMYTYRVTYNLSLKLNRKFEDIITYGYEGLIMAIDNYDAKKGSSINSYLPKAIRNSIYKNIASDEDLQVDRITYYIIKYKGYLENLFGISVENNMFMIEMLTELVSKTTNKIKKETLRHKLVSRYMRTDLTDIKYYDDYPFIDLNSEEISEYIQNGLNTLSDKQKDILIKRYGLFDNESKKCIDLADMIGITVQGINAAKHKALRKLRKNRSINELHELM